MSYHMNMEHFEKIMSIRAAPPVVGGLVDGLQADAILGEKPRTVSIWQSKRLAILKEGREPSGILGALPDPVTYLNGGAVWRKSEIEAMREIIQEKKGKPGRGQLGTK